jgi:hypothetical protein
MGRSPLWVALWPPVRQETYAGLHMGTGLSLLVNSSSIYHQVL